MLVSETLKEIGIPMTQFVRSAIVEKLERVKETANAQAA